MGSQLLCESYTIKQESPSEELDCGKYSFITHDLWSTDTEFPSNKLALLCEHVVQRPNIVKRDLSRQSQKTHDCLALQQTYVREKSQ